MDLFLAVLELLFNLFLLPITLLNLTFNKSTWVADRFFTYLLSPPPLQRFPLLKLPKVPQKLILQHVDKTELFLLSLESRVFKRILKATKPSFSHVEWTASHKELSVYTGGADKKSMFIIYQPITSKEFQENQNSKWYRMIDLNGVKLQLLIDRDPGMGFIFNYSNPHLEKQAVQAIWDYFFDHFRSPNISISSYFEPKPLVFDVFLDLRISKFIKSLTLFQPNSNPFLCEKELSKVLEGFPSVESLNLQWFYLGSNYEKALKLRKIKIHYGFALTVNCLVGMETEELEVLDCQLTSESINQFVKDWMKGGYNQLKIIKIGGKNHEFLLDQVLEGIDWKAMESRDLKFPFNNERIIRRGDGKTAAVATSQNIIRFYVQ